MPNVTYTIDSSQGLPIINQVITADDGSVLSSSTADFVTAVKVDPAIQESYLEGLNNYLQSLGVEDKSNYDSNAFMEFGRALGQLGSAYVTYGALLVQVPSAPTVAVTDPVAVDQAPVVAVPAPVDVATSPQGV